MSIITPEGDQAHPNVVPGLSDAEVQAEFNGIIESNGLTSAGIEDGVNSELLSDAEVREEFDNIVAEIDSVPAETKESAASEQSYGKGAGSDDRFWNRRGR